MIKKLFRPLLLVIFVCLAILTVSVFAADWSQYESGRDNIRLDGYQSQPGYIEFTDGNGVTRGYIWMDNDGRLKYLPITTDNAATSGCFDHTTTKLTDSLGYYFDAED